MKKFLICLISSVFVIGCASTGPDDGKRDIEVAGGADLTRDNVDKIFVVDCLLPGQVRSLGRSAQYITPRRPIKTTALDCEIRGGEYVAFDRADYATALKIWMEPARLGDPEAQTQVGEIYEKGMGVSPDYEVAALWYKKAARQKFTRAQINLGYLYEKGLGVEQDLAKAMNYYRQASGLPDEIEYVSSVELSAKNEELTSLRGEVKRLEEEANAIRKQLKDSQKKLNSASKDEKTTKTQMTDLEKRIAKLKKSLEESKKKSQKTIVIEKEVIVEKEVPVQTTDTQVVVIEKPDTSLSTRVSLAPAEVQALIKNMFAKLEAKKADLAKQGQLIAALKTETANYRQQMVAVEQQQLALSGPTIEILDPPLAITRNAKPSVLLRSPVKSQEIYGKVNAPAGLKMFRYNQSRVFLRPDSSFRIPIPINAKTIPVKLEAIDKHNKSAVLDFIISSPSGPILNTQPIQTTLKSELGNITVGQYYALVIGNNEYKNLQDLKTAVFDAEETARILTDKYGFKTTLLINADRYAILSALHKLSKKLNKEDNLLVYYAGHGDLDKVNDQGYWLPVDAESDNAANWISNIRITDLLNTMKSKHIMVVADSCYSGTLSRTSVPRIDTGVPTKIQKKWIQLMTKSKSRTVLTSGGVQPVLDEGGGKHSIFAKAFLNALNENKGILQGYALYRDVSKVVNTGSGEIQTPEYAPIRHAGHETGQFFFVPRT